MQTADRERILVLGADRCEGDAIIDELKRVDLPCAKCEDIEQICRYFRDGAAAAILAEDAIGQDALEQLASLIRDQPDRCGPPLLVISDSGDFKDAARLGTPLLIQRPVQVNTLVSWARAALRMAKREHHTLARLNEQTQSAQRVKDELAERKAELRRTKLDLEQFVFSASHELREPLRSLALYSEKLRRTPHLVLDEDTGQSLSIVLASARRMEILFRDLLAFIQVSATNPARDVEADSNAVLENVLAKLQGLIRSTGAVIHADSLPPLSMAETHLSKLLENLIENGMKYRRPGVTPRIHIFATDAANESTVYVRDNGLGIAPQHQEKVFGLFKRLHTSEEYCGTGIGLAICQKIAEQYRGQVWVESELGKGAVFCFRLPRSSGSRRALSAVSA